MEWAKTRAAAEFDLAGSNILACTLDDLPGAREARRLWRARTTTAIGRCVEAIARALRVEPGPRDDRAAARRARTSSCSRRCSSRATTCWWSVPATIRCSARRGCSARGRSGSSGRSTSGFALDPDRVAPRDDAADEGHRRSPRRTIRPACRPIRQRSTRSAASPNAHGAHVVVDEVYKDVTGRSDAAGGGARRRVRHDEQPDEVVRPLEPARRLGDRVAGDVTYRVRRARDVVDGTGSIVAERLATLAFQHLDALHARARRILDAQQGARGRLPRRASELEWVPSAGTIVFPRIRGVADAGAVRRPCDARAPHRARARLFFEAPAHFRLGYGGDTREDP